MLSEDSIGEQVCHWCGAPIESEPLLWDIPEEGTEDVYWRYRFCDDDCLDAAKHADQRTDKTHTDGESLRTESMEEINR